MICFEMFSVHASTIYQYIHQAIHYQRNGEDLSALIQLPKAFQQYDR